MSEIVPESNILN